jgi:superfamily I DNA/RNA helicase
MLGLGKKEKERLRGKFEFLEAGIWDSGVRVKKLKGLSRKVIFEARLSKGERIIFTLGRQGQQTTIYIWGLVKHDNISAAAKRVFPENAPFLDFEADSSENYSDILIDDLSEEYFSQEAIEEKSADDYGPQKWLVLSDEEWKRMLLAAGPDNFEIFLFLTSEQRGILDRDPPLLLSGTAGSGKTTISVYYLLKREFLKKKRIFLTYHRYLNEFSQKIYKGLVSRTSLANEDNAPDFYVFRDLLQELVKRSGLQYDKTKEVDLNEFEKIFRNHRLNQKYDAELVWEEIRSIIKGAKPQIRIERFKKLSQAYMKRAIGQEDLKELKENLFGLKSLDFMDKIERTVEKKTRYSQFDHFVESLSQGDEPSGDEDKFVFGEILKTMEKKAKSLSTPLLTYQEYVNLGRKRAPNFLYERKDIYDIAEFYQAKIEERGQWDEIDLCRQAIQHIGKKQGTRFGYDLVVCDEVQDFADIQIALIFSLAKSHRGIVLTGDLKQIINPSGFRWEEVKNKFYERGVEVPDVYHLNLNFRCVGNIVKLANALLDLKQRLVGLSGSELKEEWKFNGRPPFLLTGVEEKEILERLHLTGAGKIILVRDGRVQRELKKRLGTELIFTISEAKGLEFDTVFLWKFSHDKKSADIWRRIRNGDSLDRTHNPHIKHEINLLYVAITRARNTLIIFDPTNDVWDISLLNDLLWRTGEKELLSEIWQTVSTPGEWEKQGDYFFEREYYPAAAECYKNAGNLQRSEIANAFALSGKKQFKAAAPLFEKHGYAQESAECYEGAGLFENAIGLWEKLKKRDRTKLCRISLYEQQGEYNRAADEWYKLGEQSKAVEDWKKAGNHKKIAEHFHYLKEYGKAAEAFEKAREYDKAAACYKRIKKFDRAADLFYRARSFDKAIPLYKKLKNRDKLFSCYEKTDDYYNAALLWEKGKDIEKATRLFTDFLEASRENRKILLEEAKIYAATRSKLKSAIRFSALTMHEQSAPIFFEKGYYDFAVTGFRLTGNTEKAAECYVKLKDYYRAALEYEKSDVADKWGRVDRLFVQHLNPYFGEEFQRRKARLSTEAEAHFKGHSYDHAMVRYKAVSNYDGVYKVYLKVDRDEEALKYFLREPMHKFADRYLDDKKEIHVSTDFVDKMVSVYVRGSSWYARESRETEFIAKLFPLILKNNRDPGIRDLVGRFLETAHYALIHDNDLPQSVLDLILEVKHYNALLELFQSRLFVTGPLPDRLKSFAEEIKRRAHKDKDQGFLACHLFLEDRAGYDDAVEKLSVTEWNYKLLAESPKHYQRAVSYLLEKNETDEAIRICRENEDYGSAGQIREDLGEYRLAARVYRDGKHYEEAIRCYREAGDERGIASVYEKMKAFDKALAIWKRLGKTREINRVRKKMAKQQEKRDQLKLF